MILEKGDNLALFNRLTNWFERTGLSEEYFFGILNDMGLSFPLRFTNYTENLDGSFSFICSTVDNKGETIKYTIALDADEFNPRIITFHHSQGFWKQPVKV